MASVELIHGVAKPKVLHEVMKDAKEIVVISAYATSRGLSEIDGPLLACARRGGDITMLLGVDRAVASPQLVRDLGTLLRKAKGRLRVVLVVEAGKTFLHAKVFAARKPRVADVLIGSFNLTGRGLQGNHELAARVTGNASIFFAELHGFIQSIPPADRHDLTVSNVDELARALEPTRHDADPEETARRRQEAADRLAAVLKAVRQGAGWHGASPAADPAREVARLVHGGAFFRYDVDLEKLSIPSGLQRVYDAGLLSKQATQKAGIFDVKQTNALTASAQLVPPDRRKEFRALSTRLGKALGAFGFETAFGHWVPRALQASMQARVDRLAATAPAGHAFEREVRRFIEAQLAEFDGSTRKLLDRVTSHGVQRPALWRHVQDPVLRRIKANSAAATDDEWRGSLEERQAVGWIEEHLMQVKSKLDAERAIARLRRVRPEVVRMPVEPTSLSDDDVRRVLECIVWAVAEGRAQRRNRPVLKPLLARVEGDPKQIFQRMQSVSEALIEGVPGSEEAFLAVFGMPPYWEDTVDAEDDGEDEDEDGEHDEN